MQLSLQVTPCKCTMDHSGAVNPRLRNTTINYVSFDALFVQHIRRCLLRALPNITQLFLCCGRVHRSAEISYNLQENTVSTRPDEEIISVVHVTGHLCILLSQFRVHDAEAA